MAKPFYSSKTFWWNVITFTLGLVSLTQFQDIIPKSWTPYILLVNAVGNMILRLFFTNGPTTTTQSAANLINAVH